MKKINILLIIIGAGVLWLPFPVFATTYVDTRNNTNLSYWSNINDGSALMNIGLPVFTNSTTSLVLEFASFTGAGGANLGGCNYQVLALNSLSAGSPQNAIVGSSVDVISSSTVTIATTTAVLYVYGMHFTSAVEATRYYMNGTYNCANAAPFLSRYPHSLDGYVQNADTSKVPNGVTWGALCDSSSYSPSTGCAPQVLPPNLTFLHPLAGSTQALLFNNFALSVANLTSTNSYFISVQTGVVQTNVQNTQSSPTVLGSTMLGNGVLVKNKLLFSNQGLQYATSVPIYAIATLYDVTNFSAPNSLLNYAIASTSILFTSLIQTSTINTQINISLVNNSGTLQVVTSTGSSGFENYVTFNSSTPSGLFNCTPPSNITDWGGGIAYGACYAGNLFFSPNASVYNGFGSALNSFQDVFPFNVVFGIANSVGGSVTSSVGLASGNLSMNVLGLNGYVDLGDINSSTDVRALTTGAISNDVGNVSACNTACATEKVGNMFNVFIMLIWLTAGIKMVAMVTKFHYS